MFRWLGPLALLGLLTSANQEATITHIENGQRYYEVPVISPSFQWGMTAGGCDAQPWQLGNLSPCEDRNMARRAIYSVYGVPAGRYRIVLLYRSEREDRWAEVQLEDRRISFFGRSTKDELAQVAFHYIGPQSFTGRGDHLRISRTGLMPIISRIWLIPEGTPIFLPPEPTRPPQPPAPRPQSPPRPDASPDVSICIGDRELNFAGCMGRYVYACNRGSQAVRVTYEYYDNPVGIGEVFVGRRTGRVTVAGGGRTQLTGSTNYAAGLSLTGAPMPCRSRDHRITSVQ